MLGRALVCERVPLAGLDNPLFAAGLKTFFED
jgi:hypothetical protein